MKRFLPVIVGIAACIAACTPRFSPSGNGLDKPGNPLETAGSSAAVSNTIDWQFYEPASSIPATGITAKDIQGLWNAYKGIARFGAFTHTVQLGKTIFVDIRDQQLQRDSAGMFQPFSLKENLIIVPGSGKADTGIINKITPKELTVSWKTDSNYTRYYYRK